MMTKRDMKDNFNSTRSAIAKRILSSSLREHIGYQTDPRRLERLERVASGEDTRFGFDLVSCEFKRAGTNCDLSVGYETHDSSYSDPLRDAEGNEWAQYRIWCEVNHPCHGSCAPATLLARIELYREVALLAAAIDVEFGDRHNGPDVWRMTKTAAQAAEEAARREAERVKREVAIVIDMNKDHMRIGNVKPVPMREITDRKIPAGEYEHECYGKRYNRYNMSVAFGDGCHAPVALLTRTV